MQLMKYINEAMYFMYFNVAANEKNYRNKKAMSFIICKTKYIGWNTFTKLLTKKINET